MVAVKKIDQDVCIVRIPKRCLLESNNIEIKELIKEGKLFSRSCN